MERVGKSFGVRGVYKLRNISVFDGFAVYYNGEGYSTTLNQRTSVFFNHIKRQQMVIRYKVRGLVFRNYMIYSNKWGMVKEVSEDRTFTFSKEVDLVKINLFKHIKRIR